MMSRCRFVLLAACAASLLADERARAEPLPPELNLIPRDAALFVSVRVADLWNESKLKPLRDFLVEDRHALRNLERETSFRPEEIERVTFVFPSFHSQRVISEPLIVATLRKPYDLGKLLDAFDGMTEVEMRRFEGEGRFPKSGGIAVPKGFPTEPKRIEEKPPNRPAKDPAPDKDIKGSSDCGQIIDPTERPLRDKNRPRDLKAPYYLLPRNGGFLIPINERTVVIGLDNGMGGHGFREVSGLHDLLAALLKRSEKGPLTTAIEAAAGKHSVVVGVNLPAARAAIPEKGFVNALPIDTLMKCRSAMATLDFGDEIRIALHVEAADEAMARRMLEVLRSVHVLGMESLVGLKNSLIGPDNAIDENSVGGMLLTLVEPILREAKLDLKGTTASIVMANKIDEQLAKTIKAAIERVKEAAARSQALTNLKHFGIAVHNYASVYGDQLPFPGASAPKGQPQAMQISPKPNLSWRVVILPYIEQQALYNQFRFDEPWDSEHNKKLIPLMPKVYALPGQSDALKGHTFYRVFSGKGAIGDGRFRISTVPDGTSNTILVVEAAESVPWTKPDEFPFDPAKPLPKLGGHLKGKVNVLMVDGSVRTIDLAKVSERTLKLAIQGDDGLPLPSDW